MRPELFTISRTGPGTLSTMARPRGGEWLDDEISALASAGVRVLVSLLTDNEMSELDLAGEPQAAQAAGLTFYRLPTPDLGVPDREECLALAEALKSHLAVGDGVAIHCRHGIGRSSTLAAAVLVLEGIQPSQAWALISQARGMAVPDNPAQRDAIYNLREHA